jgi:hypothetical protein
MVKKMLVLALLVPSLGGVPGGRIADDTRNTMRWWQNIPSMSTESDAAMFSGAASGLMLTRAAEVRGPVSPV